MKMQILLSAAILVCAVAARAEERPARGHSAQSGHVPAEKNPDPASAESLADKAAVAAALPALDKSIAGLDKELEDIAACHSLEDALKADLEKSQRRYSEEFKNNVPLEFNEILQRKRMRTEKARQVCAEKYKRANVKFDETLNQINAVNTSHPGSAEIKTRLASFQKARKSFAALERGKAGAPPERGKAAAKESSAH